MREINPRARRPWRTALALTALLAGGVLPAMPARAAPPPDLDHMVHSAMRAFGTPGLSLAIVENGRTVVAKGYGVRSIVTRAPVNAHTLFPIGSETKAFTSAALAILAEEGKLKWSDHVAAHLPGFRMYDPYATAHMTIRDLLTHRSGLGLGEGDLLIVPASTRSGASVVHALRYLKPRTGFREVFAYDNVLYIAAGSMVQAISGEPWSRFVRERILDPLGMTDVTTAYDPDAPNAVALHARIDGPIRGIGPLSVLHHWLDSPAASPAGGINASALDMARWMTMWQEDGRLPDGRRLLSAKAVHALRSPVVVVPVNAFGAPASVLPKPALQDYALGWFVEVDDGQKVIEHDGGVLGGLAALYFIPGKHVAFSICINSEDVDTLEALVYELLDYYSGRPRRNWVPVLLKLHRALVKRQLAALKQLSPAYRPNSHSSLPIRDYAGVYADPWYGRMTIEARAGGRLRIRFDETPGMQGALEHVANDIFQTHWSQRGIPDAYVMFTVRQGRVARLAMKPVSPWTDFSFDYRDLHFAPVH